MVLIRCRKYITHLAIADKGDNITIIFFYNFFFNFRGSDDYCLSDNLILLYNCFFYLFDEDSLFFGCVASLKMESLKETDIETCFLIYTKLHIIWYGTRPHSSFNEKSVVEQIDHNAIYNWIIVYWHWKGEWKKK